MPSGLNRICFLLIRSILWSRFNLPAAAFFLFSSGFQFRPDRGEPGAMAIARIAARPHAVHARACSRPKCVIR